MRTDAKTAAKTGKAIQTETHETDLHELGLLEVPFVDQNGEDLGSFHLEDTQTVSEIIREVVAESGLPSRDPKGQEKRYEGFQGGRKLAPTSTAREAGLATGEAVEVYPSVMTGGLA